MWADFVEDSWQNPDGAFFNMPALHTLPDDHREIILLLIAAIHDVFQKHLLSHLSRSDGFTSSTNRVGETVFRYMCATFDRNQNTRMVLIAAQFIGKRSKYVANVIEDPTLMEDLTPSSKHAEGGGGEEVAEQQGVGAVVQALVAEPPTLRA